MRKFLSLLVVLLTTFTSAWADGSKGLQTGYVTYKADGTPNSKKAYTYDAQGNMTCSTDFGWSNNAWKNRLKMEYSHDAQGNKTGYICYMWTNEAWAYSSKYENTYNAQGQNTLSMRYGWTNDTWVNNYKTEYSYDANGNQTGYITYRWVNEAWINSAKYEYTYDAQGNKTSEINYNWPSGATDWNSWLKYEYTYDTQGRMTQSLESNKSGSAWVNSSKTEYSYDAQGHQTGYISYDWKNNAWAESKKYEYTYDALGNKSSEKSYSWSNNTWTLSNYDLYSYNYDYLCFTNVDDKSINVKFDVDGAGTYTLPSIQYSTDKTLWTNYDFTSNAATNHTITLAAGEKVYFKAETTNSTFSTFTNSSNKSTITFTSDGKVAASGNIMSLLDATCESKTVSDYAFNSLFQNCSTLTTAPELPATTLANHCYYYMFRDCSSLTAAPNLPATTLADFCYYYMFQGCSSLTVAPKLPAENLAVSCYRNMFTYCTSLTTAPELNAKTLAKSCYYSMFYGCTSLTAAPELSATTLADYCYYGMFGGCTSLTAAPELSATTLADYCYYSMFSGCTSLTAAPELSATTLADYCYKYMFFQCINLILNTEGPGTEWKIDAISVGTEALKDMFKITGGTLTGAPTNGTTYYIASLPAVQLNSNGYATYSSAQNVDIETAGVTAYTATVSGSTITLNAIASDSYIPAGVGVVLYGEDMANKVVKFKSPVNTTAASTTDNALKSTLVAGSTAGAYKVDAKPTTGYTFALGDGSTFLHYTGSTFIANRAYFNLATDPAPASEAKAMTLVFGDATGVAQIQNSEFKIQNYSGKYIENGRIVILKNGRKYNTAGQQVK